MTTRTTCYDCGAKHPEDMTAPLSVGTEWECSRCGRSGTFGKPPGGNPFAPVPNPGALPTIAERADALVQRHREANHRQLEIINRLQQDNRELQQFIDVLAGRIDQVEVMLLDRGVAPVIVREAGKILRGTGVAQ